MDVDIPGYFRQKLKDYMEERLNSIQNKLNIDLSLLDSLKDSYCQIVENSGSEFTNSNGEERRLKKYNSLTSLNEYKKLSSDETDITNENNEKCVYNKVITPIKKTTQKNLKNEDKTPVYKKVKPIERINMKPECKTPIRNLPLKKAQSIQTQENEKKFDKNKIGTVIKYPISVRVEKQGKSSFAKEKPPLKKEYLEKFVNKKEPKEKESKEKANTNETADSLEKTSRNGFRPTEDHIRLTEENKEFTRMKSRTVHHKSTKSKFLKSHAPLENLIFKNRKEKALAIFTLSSYVNIKTRLYLNLFCKHLTIHFPSVKVLILQRSIYEYEKIIFYLYSKIKHYLEDEHLKDLVSRPFFVPSKTAQNGINFITSQDEQNLLKKTQPVEIINLFKILFIIMNEDYSGYEEEKLVECFMTHILKKYNVENLSINYYELESLFLNKVVKQISLTVEQMDKIHKIIHDYPKVLQSTEILRMNRGASFMSFIVKEIVDYFSTKTEDGVYVGNIRRLYLKYQQVLEKQQKLKSIVFN